MEIYKHTPEWEEEFQLVRRNSIYFIENYWNKIHPENKIELTDEEKQKYYHKYRMVPIVTDLRAHDEYLKELKKKGIKDWEANI